MKTFQLYQCILWATLIVGPWMSVTASTDDLNVNLDAAVDAIKDALFSLKDAIIEKSETVNRLAVQTIRNQMQLQERIRAQGDSGIVQIRTIVEGSSNYMSSTASSHSFAALHDRSMTRRKLGMGEVKVVMNGIEFRTSHSDYDLVMPSTNSSEWLATEPIPFPPVPPSVEAQPTVQDQITEMQEYFRAFKFQDPNIRDYAPYFKPVLCYLEAAWGNETEEIESWHTTNEEVQKGYTWDEAHDRYRAESVMGTKDKSEETAYLPTTIVTVDEFTGEPVYAQWNYRQLCYPINEDLPTQYFREVDEVAYRLRRGLGKNETFFSRGAHFRLDTSSTPGTRQKELLHRLISRIPGMDNIPSQLSQPILGNIKETDVDTGNELDLGYYNHWYFIGWHEGYKNYPRGFSDASLFVAMTTQDKVAAIPVNRCLKPTNCFTRDLRVSYMIPLEVVYMTPLLSWNPLNVTDFGAANGKVKAGGKMGSRADKAVEGISDEYFFQTPSEFFNKADIDSDPADLNRMQYWVKNSQGKPYPMASSGTRMILPVLSGVRIRYPIAPVHDQGSAVWKELNAFKDSMAQCIKY